MALDHRELNILSFNCFGLKSALHPIENFIDSKSCDILFLSEHWLHESEIPTVSDFFTLKGYQTYIKSGMNPDEVISGRPYGGVGFVCKLTPGIVYRNLNVDNRRISAVQLIVNGRIALTIFGVYLPHFDGSSEQIIHYAETIDALQCLINDLSSSPVMIVGDLNASLPSNDFVMRNWYKSHPYNEHSLVLNDFLSDNDFFVANFSYKQDVKYTYFKGSHRSYIDHVLVNDFSFSMITDCKILHCFADNTSDHLPILTRFHVKLSKPYGDDYRNEVLEDIPKFPKCNWDSETFRTMYIEYLNSNLVDINSSKICDSISAQTFVDSSYHNLTSTLHNACRSVNDHINSISNIQSKRRKVPWWSNNCTIARDRQRFWFHIWKRCGRPRNGQVYECYKFAKKRYRQVCRNSINEIVSSKFHNINKLYMEKNPKKFWNAIKKKKAKNSKPSDSDININSLESFFKSKFDCSSTNICSTETAKNFVSDKFFTLSDKLFDNYAFNKDTIIRLIGCLNTGSAPGPDGITVEHLKHSICTKVPNNISIILNICIKFGVVPKAFQEGILVPILKKPNVDPSLPENYRPITVSNIVSKILELCFIESCSNIELDPSQYGFINGRGTAMATATANDVVTYCVNKGSTVYACSLDAEGAFDAIPHDILFMKLANAVSDDWWRLLYRWYTHLSVCIKWNNKLSNAIKVRKGTRQGGLSSPLIFNLFYKDMIKGISELECGVKITNVSFNVFCYADDVLLISNSASGLQILIDYANEYISKHGLRFNPTKTECVIFGKQFLVPEPRWYLHDSLVNVSEYGISFG